jgi:type II secretory pathway pseudopilin PulG
MVNNEKRACCGMEIKKIQGYTLIELIIVVGMMLGLTAVMVLNGTDSRHLANLESAARQLEATLSQAQAYGNSGRAFPPGESDPEDFDKGYGVFLTKNGDTVFMYGGQGDLNSDDSYEGDERRFINQSPYPGGQEYEAVKLEGSVVISEMRGNASSQNANEAHILFKRGEPIVHIYSNNQEDFSDLAITLESGGFEKKVMVYDTGLIYEE